VLAVITAVIAAFAGGSFEFMLRRWGY
jgi:hypothetical protein